jgi:hypothetical protein
MFIFRKSYLFFFFDKKIKVAKLAQQISDQYCSQSSYAGLNSFGGNSMDRETGYNNKGSMHREFKGQKVS